MKVHAKPIPTSTATTDFADLYTKLPNRFPEWMNVFVEKECFMYQLNIISEATKQRHHILIKGLTQWFPSTAIQLPIASHQPCVFSGGRHKHKEYNQQTRNRRMTKSMAIAWHQRQQEINIKKEKEKWKASGERNSKEAMCTMQAKKCTLTS